MPCIRPLVSVNPKSDAAQHSTIRYFLDGVSQGKTLDQILPVKNTTTPTHIPSETKTSLEDLEALDRIFQARIEENRKAREMVMRMNECPDPTIQPEDDAKEDDEERPVSPGQEYDMQYMLQVFKGPRFKASVHEQLLSAQNMNPHERQQLISCAKDVEESLARDHSKLTEDFLDPKRVPPPPRRPRAPRPQKAVAPGKPAKRPRGRPRKA